MTRMHHLKPAIAMVAVLLMLSLVSTALALTIEVDKTAVVSSVTDGSSFALNSGEKVKLASIDTPSLGDNGYSESRNYLVGLVQGKTVYLTVDSAATDPYSRLVCIAYLDYNSTHYENVNMAMIQNHYAVPSAANNSKFDPANWVWFVSKDAPAVSPTASPISTPTATPTPSPFSPPTPNISPDIPEIPSSIVIILVVLIISPIILAQFHRLKKQKMKN